MRMAADANPQLMRLPSSGPRSRAPTDVPGVRFYRECVEPPILGRSSVANRRFGDEREADSSQPNRRLRASTDARPAIFGGLDF
jgi:hypothetical protein